MSGLQATQRLLFRSLEGLWEQVALWCMAGWSFCQDTHTHTHTLTGLQTSLAPLQIHAFVCIIMHTYFI